MIVKTEPARQGRRDRGDQDQTAGMDQDRERSQRRAEHKILQHGGSLEMVPALSLRQVKVTRP